MSHKYVAFKPIGIIHTEYKDKTGVPIQPCFSDTKAKIEVIPKFSAGLKDLDGFSHIVLLYYFHKSKNYDLLVRPFLDNKKRGVFATRAPKRPNPIGISVVELEKIENNILYVKGVDIIDQTPLLDIKPYVKEFDIKKSIKQGWLENKVKKNHKSDNRFD